MSGTLTPTNPTIVFNEIPYDWRVPGTYLEVRPNYATIGLVPFPSKLLIIGQKLSAGTAAANTPQLITRPDQANALFGVGSVAADMVNTALKADPTSTITAIGVADAGGATKATGTVVITGTQTAAGQIYVYVAGKRVRIPVGASDSLTTIQSAATAAFAAVFGLPVSVTSAIVSTTLTITLTALHGGLVGNEIDVRLNLAAGDVLPPGLTVTATSLSGGTGNPDCTAALSAVASDWYTDIAFAWTDATNLGVLTTELARRYTAMERLDAHAFIAWRGTVSALATLGNAQNSQFLTAVGLKNPVSPGWIIAASLAAKARYELTNDPARQLRTVPLPGVIGSAPADRFIPSEEDVLLRDGVAIVRTAGDYSVTCERIITTYQTSSLGVADVAWLDVTVPKVMTRLRYDWRAFLNLVYPRNKLADDGALAAEYDDSIVTPARMRISWAGRCRLYEQYGWIEGSKATAAASLFVRDATDRNRLNTRQEVRIIGNLMVLAGALEFQG